MELKPLENKWNHAIQVGQTKVLNNGSDHDLVHDWVRTSAWPCLSIGEVAEDKSGTATRLETEKVGTGEVHNEKSDGSDVDPNTVGGGHN